MSVGADPTPQEAKLILLKTLKKVDPHLFLNPKIISKYVYFVLQQQKFIVDDGKGGNYVDPAFYKTNGGISVLSLKIVVGVDQDVEVGKDGKNLTGVIHISKLADLGDIAVKVFVVSCYSFFFNIYDVIINEIKDCPQWYYSWISVCAAIACKWYNSAMKITDKELRISSPSIRTASDINKDTYVLYFDASLKRDMTSIKKYRDQIIEERKELGKFGEEVKGEPHSQDKLVSKPPSSIDYVVYSSDPLSISNNVLTQVKKAFPKISFRARSLTTGTKAPELGLFVLQSDSGASLAEIQDKFLENKGDRCNVVLYVWTADSVRNEKWIKILKDELGSDAKLLEIVEPEGVAFKVPSDLVKRLASLFVVSQ